MVCLVSLVIWSYRLEIWAKMGESEVLILVSWALLVWYFEGGLKARKSGISAAELVVNVDLSCLSENRLPNGYPVPDMVNLSIMIFPYFTHKRVSPIFRQSQI